MSWVAVGVSVVGTVGGAMLSGRAAKDAANAQKAQGDAALAFQYEQMDRQERMLNPYLETGNAANLNLRRMMDSGELTKEFEFGADPGYQFGLRQGEEALTRQQSARGLRTSPASLRALMQFNQDYAGTKYNDAFQRDMAGRQQRFGMLSDLAGRGQASGVGQAQLNSGYAQQAGNMMTGIGNAQAAGVMGAANAYGGAVGQVGNQAGQAYMLNQYLKNSGKTGSGSTGGGGWNSGGANFS